MRNRQDAGRPDVPPDEVIGTTESTESPDLTPAEREVESALAALRPAGSDGATDRDRLLRLMFRAGQADTESRPTRRGGRELLLWRAVAAVLLVGFGLVLTLKPWGERVVYLSAPADRDERVVTPATAPAGVPDFPRENIPAPSPSDRLVTLPAPRDTPPTGGDYLALRNAVLARGLDALPATPGPRSAPPPAPRASDPIRLPTFGDRL